MNPGNAKPSSGETVHIASVICSIIALFWVIY